MKGEDVPSPSLILISHPRPVSISFPCVPSLSSPATKCTVRGLWLGGKDRGGDAADLLPWRGSQSLGTTNSPELRPD